VIRTAGAATGATGTAAPFGERDYVARWLVIAVIAIVAAAGVAACGVAVDLRSAWVTAGPLVLLMMMFRVYRRLGQAWPPARFGSDVCVDAIDSLVQVTVALQIVVVLSYLAARVGSVLPLRDAALARIDAALLGFEWDRAARWVASRPVLSSVLDSAYFSLRLQALVLIIISSIVRTGSRNGELVWLTLVAALLTVLVFVATPAMGKVGHLGPAYGATLTSIRAGTWTRFDYAEAQGIVTFPSFHTAMGLIYVYVAGRLRRWLLVVFVPLNAAMIIAVVPIGGHYLVDALGGAAVAALSVAVVRCGAGGAANPAGT